MGVIRRSESLGLTLVNCLHENIVLLEKQAVAQGVKKFSILNDNPVFITIQKTTKNSIKSTPILIHRFFKINLNISFLHIIRILQNYYLFS
jgi:hypothetical protein